MSKWKCEICGVEFENFHAQGFDNKIYCPLCYFKRENQELKKQLEEINDFITEKLHRSGTFWESKGAFTDDKRYMIMVVLNRPQAKELRAFVKKVDKHAFVVINNTSNIIGKGFREI